MNVEINYITDGDIAGHSEKDPINDIYYSTGGARGCCCGAALSCYGGRIQGRLVLNDEEN